MKEFLHHLLFPRESNNHRAKLLHQSSLLFLTILFFMGGVVLPPLQKRHPDILGISTNISLDRLYQLTNEKRIENGLPPLTLNASLSNAAAGKAQDMFIKNYWAHFAPDGGTPWGFIKGAGYQYTYAGENLARGYTTADEVVSAWMASPGHRENILSSNYKEIGFAIQSGSLTGEDTTLVVQMFGSRNETAQVAQAPVVTSAPLPTQPLPLISSSSAPIAAPVTTPTPVILQVTPTPVSQVAAIQQEPLVNTKPLAQSFTGLMIFLFILVLVVDVIVIKRRKIVRIVSHNLDHIIYLTVIFVALTIIVRGAIL